MLQSMGLPKSWTWEHVYSVQDIILKYFFVGSMYKLWFSELRYLNKGLVNYSLADSLFL